MFQRFVAWFACYLLKYKTLNTENRIRLVNAITTKLAFVPITDIIKINGGSISVNGVPLDHEQVMSIRQGATAALQNRALQFVHNQATYEAIKMGIYTVTDMNTALFSKASLWHGSKERELLTSLALITSESDIGQELA